MSVTPAPVTVEGEDLTITDSFTDLGSIVRQVDEPGSDILSRLNKPKNVFCSKKSI